MTRHGLIGASSLLLALAVFVPEASALIVVGTVNVSFTSPPTIQGGTFNATAPSPTGGLSAGNDVNFVEAGDFSFTAGGGPVTISYTMDTVITLFNQFHFDGQFVLGSYLDGVFATQAQGHQVFLTQFSSDTSVVGVAQSEVQLGSPVSDGQPALLPYVSASSVDAPYTSFLNESQSAYSPLFPLDTSSLDIRQQVTVSFSGLVAGDVVDVIFPNGGSLTSVPEPSSLILGLTGGLALFGGYVLRRFRRVSVA